ncbi:TPA: transcriptional repressor, partial [Listeria monocytogenes]|nr:transcriptional repressor [Listeria monocytogenes]
MAVSNATLKEAVDVLKKTGVRITPQRHAILEFLINS